jgi:hypothetical protein
MSYQNTPETDDQFDALFRKAEESDTFWISKAKFHFTEEMLAQMDALRINKVELASRLEVLPAQITRLCSGRNNFTIATMVKIARALKCQFRSHLQPEGTSTCWIDVLKDEPKRFFELESNSARFKTLTTVQITQTIPNDCIAA